MNLFPYASAIALSWTFVASLLPAYFQFKAVFRAPVSRDDALSGGFLSGEFLARGFLSRGLCPGGFCPRTSIRT